MLKTLSNRYDGATCSTEMKGINHILIVNIESKVSTVSSKSRPNVIHYNILNKMRKNDVWIKWYIKTRYNCRELTMRFGKRKEPDILSRNRHRMIHSTNTINMRKGGSPII